MANDEFTQTTVGQLVGRNLVRLRQAYGLRQEEVALLVNTVAGMRWTRSVVAYIESGQRKIELSEFVALCIALEVTTTELLAGRAAELVLYDDGDHGAPLRDLRKVLAGGTVPPPNKPPSRAEVEQLQEDALGEAERKVAAKFDVPAIVVAQKAQALWGRSLTAERDRRVLETPPGKNLRAARGWVTRVLIDELEPSLTPLKGMS